MLCAHAVQDVEVALDLAQTIFRRIWLNYMWAFLYNLVMLPLAAGAFYPAIHWRLPPWGAGAAMVRVERCKHAGRMLLQQCVLLLRAQLAQLLRVKACE